MTGLTTAAQHLRDIKRIKAAHTDADYCAACGILLDQAWQMPGEPPSNGVCCPACLAERPELHGMDRDQVTLWHYEVYGTVMGAGSNNAHVAAARAWLRIQARLGRDDDNMADVAAMVYGAGERAQRRLHEYVRKLRERRRESVGMAAS